MYNCECGHYRCSKPVSRRTWYRHKLAMILGNQQDLEDNQIPAPLPVESAPLPDEDDVHQDQPDFSEVQILGYLLGYLHYAQYPNNFYSFHEKSFVV
jgi:hypothetical protein